MNHMTPWFSAALLLILWSVWMACSKMRQMMALMPVRLPQNRSGRRRRKSPARLFLD